jgi:hypothetical protein
MDRPLLMFRGVRGLQWWNSSAWTIGSPDGMVWTNGRTLRRARAVRLVKLGVALAVAALLGALLVLAVFAPHHTEPPPLHVMMR